MTWRGWEFSDMSVNGTVPNRLIKGAVSMTGSSCPQGHCSQGIDIGSFRVRFDWIGNYHIISNKIR